MTNKNILIVVQNDLLGGAEQLLKTLASEYNKKENSVSVIILRKPMQYNWKDLHGSIEVKYINSTTYLLGFIRLTFFLISFTKKKKN